MDPEITVPPAAITFADWQLGELPALPPGTRLVRVVTLVDSTAAHVLHPQCAWPPADLPSFS